MTHLVCLSRWPTVHDTSDTSVKHRPTCYISKRPDLTACYYSSLHSCVFMCVLGRGCPGGCGIEVMLCIVMLCPVLSVPVSLSKVLALRCQNTFHVVSFNFYGNKLIFWFWRPTAAAGEALGQLRMALFRCLASCALYPLPLCNLKWEGAGETH